MSSLSSEMLLLDIGNSRIKWGTADDNGKIFVIGSAIHRDRDISTLANQHWTNLSPKRVIASNVAGNNLANTLREWINTNWQIALELLIPQQYAYGVSNAYHNPSHLGADRWAALLGAARRPHGHLCVVDCGTAVTIDILLANNQHQGGLIMPGLNLMRSSLITGTAGVKFNINLDTPATLLGCDTDSAVNNGTLYAITALINHVVANLALTLAAEVSVIITGGDSELIIPFLHSNIEYRANLVLEGLALFGIESHKLQSQSSLI